MPLLTGVHEHIERFSADAVVNAHQTDQGTQPDHDVRRYCYDERTGKVFCLVEARIKGRSREAQALADDQFVAVLEGAK